MHHDSTPGCRPGHRCRRWRHCWTCARIRQRQLADAAEALDAHTGPLDYAVVTPDAPGSPAIKAILEAYRTTAGLHAGLWTLEQGRLAHRLHINIIAPRHPPPRLADARVWHRHIDGSPRHTAAYCAKREQAPHAADYAGHTRGRWGPLAFFLLDPSSPATVQAKTADLILAEITAQDPAQSPPTMPDPINTRNRADFAAIANRHLPALAAWAAAHPHPRKELTP